MTEHDGLTAEQEAERRYPTDRLPNPRLTAFVAGAEWATEREKARAEAAEARVAELEGALRKIDWTAYENWLSIDRMEAMQVLARDALCPPTTEAVTEVEGS